MYSGDLPRQMVGSGRRRGPEVRWMGCFSVSQEFMSFAAPLRAPLPSCGQRSRASEDACRRSDDHNSACVRNRRSAPSNSPRHPALQWLPHGTTARCRRGGPCWGFFPAGCRWMDSPPARRGCLFRWDRANGALTGPASVHCCSMRPCAQHLQLLPALSQ